MCNYASHLRTVPLVIRHHFKCTSIEYLSPEHPIVITVYHTIQIYLTILFAMKLRRALKKLLHRWFTSN